MIPEQLATFIAIGWLVRVMVIGAALGVGVSFFLRLRWHWWRPFSDMLVALVATIVVIVAGGLYQRNREYHDVGWLFELVGMASPALVHFLVFLIRRFEARTQHP